jgi:hypothetical protein
MAHELAGALQQAGRIRQRGAVKETYVYVRSEYIDIAEGRISQTCNRTPVMQKLPDLVPAFSHHVKPLVRDGSQFARMLFHPRIDGAIPLDGAVESQQFRSPSLHVLYVLARLARYSSGQPKPSTVTPRRRSASIASMRR